MESHEIRLPNTGVYVDMVNAPGDFYKLVSDSFANFTKGTSKAYTFEDKLAYLDHIRHALYHNMDDCDIVKEYIKGRIDWELDEYGDLPDKDDFWSLETFEDLVSHGDRKLHYRTYDNHKDEKIQKNLLRLIKIVIDWEWEDA